MRTKFIVVLALALAAGTLVVQMAGFQDSIGQDPAAGMDAGDRLEKQANESAANTGLEGNARASDGDLVGIIISGVQRGVTVLIAFTALLPFTLNKMYIPWYAAYPFGVFGQVLMGIGIIQWATNRVYE